MTTALDVGLAEARVAQARARLSGTVEALQTQLAPARIARDVGESVAESAQAAASVSVAAAQRNPRVAGGALALALLILGRRRIARVVRRVRGKPKPMDIPGDPQP